jgi:LmbE family N-acetylglucosaminyl deacetylase
VPIREVAARLTGLFERYEPQVVVTYSDYSGYNHPDHLHAHQVTMAAVERSRIPAKLYLIARRRRDWEELRRRLEAQGVEMPARRPVSPEAQRRMDEIESSITTTIDTARVAHRKRAALAAHASQLDGSWWLTLPEEAIATVFGRETFIRAYDTTGAPLPEDDLFAGLR